MATYYLQTFETQDPLANYGLIFTTTPQIYASVMILGQYEYFSKLIQFKRSQDHPPPFTVDPNKSYAIAYFVLCNLHTESYTKPIDNLGMDDIRDIFELAHEWGITLKCYDVLTKHIVDKYCDDVKFVMRCFQYVPKDVVAKYCGPIRDKLLSLPPSVKTLKKAYNLGATLRYLSDIIWDNDLFSEFQNELLTSTEFSTTNEKCCSALQVNIVYVSTKIISSYCIKYAIIRSFNPLTITMCHYRPTPVGTSFEEIIQFSYDFPSGTTIYQSDLVHFQLTMDYKAGDPILLPKNMNKYGYIMAYYNAVPATLAK